MDFSSSNSGVSCDLDEFLSNILDDVNEAADSLLCIQSLELRSDIVSVVNDMDVTSEVSLELAQSPEVEVSLILVFFSSFIRFF